MTRAWLVLLLVTSIGAAPAAAGSRDSTASEKPPKVKEITLLIGNRAFPDFMDVEKAPIGKEFQVGETDYTARVVEFLPDFAIDIKKHRITSRSNALRNPACRVIVRRKGVATDTSWAFVNFPPHFSPRSLLSFRVVQVDFFNRPSITVVPDTSGAEKPK